MSTRSRPLGAVLNPEPEVNRMPAEWWKDRLIVHRGEIFQDPEGDEYEAVKLLGRGTFSDVIKCKVRGCLPARAALKIFRSPPEFRAAGERECSIHRALVDGPDLPGRRFVVQPLTAFDIGDHFCIVLQLLVPFIFPELLPDPEWRANRIRSLIIGLCEALAFVHAAGVVHLDVKPENLLFDPDDPDHAILVDFGSARRADAVGKTTVQTTQYRSPEAILGLPVGPAADMWSLGCVALELFLGGPLFGFGSEFDVMHGMVAVVGSPPEEILESAPRTNEFFDGGVTRENPVEVVQRRHEMPRIFAGGMTIDEILAGDGVRPLRELVRALLEWDSTRRISAEDALAHEYCQKKIEE
jgi:serine/threonine protein kinase